MRKTRVNRVDIERQVHEVVRFVCDFILNVLPGMLSRSVRPMLERCAAKLAAD